MSLYIIPSKRGGATIPKGVDLIPGDDDDCIYPVENRSSDILKDGRLNLNVSWRKTTKIKEKIIDVNHAKWQNKNYLDLMGLYGRYIKYCGRNNLASVSFDSLSEFLYNSKLDIRFGDMKVEVLIEIMSHQNDVPMKHTIQR